MRRPDKRLLPSWATEDPRKLRALSARKLPRTAQSHDEAVEAICAVVRRIPFGWVATYGLSPVWKTPS